MSMRDANKLLGGLPFISRTFEGGFKDNPFVLDMDANLYIGPADHLQRDEHAGIEVVYHFLAQTGRDVSPIGALLRNRLLLLTAFAEFDAARGEDSGDEFRILIFGTYDGEPLRALDDDELPAGPCGKSVNEIKRRFYATCGRLDSKFEQRELDSEQREIERRFLQPA